MAYVSKERKAAVAPNIKTILDKYGLKGTLSVRYHRTLVLTIRSGKLDLIGDYNNHRVKMLGLPCNADSIDGANYLSKDTPHYELYQELTNAMKGEGWYDRSDIMTDYFDAKYYVEINVGEWKKPYHLTT